MNPSNIMFQDWAAAPVPFVPSRGNYLYPPTLVAWCLLTCCSAPSAKSLIPNKIVVVNGELGLFKKHAGALLLVPKMW